MPSFKNIEDLIANVNSNINNYMRSQDSELQREISYLMKEAVEIAVYDVYEPKVYERREKGGLSDPDNLRLIDAKKLSNRVTSLVFENMTKGNISDYYQEYIADTIVNGIKSNWLRHGAWSEPRDFVSKLTELVNQRKPEINNAIKMDLRKMGYKVR